METNRLRQFQVVVETQNLRRAAEILGISHSGLSKSMKALEQEIGQELFLPSGRGIVVTDAGRDFFSRTQSFLPHLKALLGEKITVPSQVLRLGSFETFTSFFIGPLLAEYWKDLSVEVHELIPGRLEEALLSAKVDFGVTYEPIPRHGVSYVRVATLTMGAFVRRGEFSKMALSEIPFVVPVHPLESAASGVKGRDGWPDDKLERREVYKVDLLGTGLELVRQGLGAIFIPQFVAQMHNQRQKPEFQLESLALPRGLAHVRREVYVVKRESSPEDKALRQLARALRDLCGD